jgi:arylformamidase
MIYDISVSINEDMMVYKNREAKKPVFTQSASFKENGVYETDIKMNLHTGTHIDFPLHTLENGKTSQDHALEPFIGEAKVFDLSHVNDGITEADLTALDIQKNDFVLFKTKNSFEEAFNFEFIYLKLDAAKYLVSKGIRGVGIDALGIERNQPNHPTHDTLLKNDIVILEGIKLDKVSEGTYHFICLPLKIDNVEALPVRAVLIDKSNV